MKLYLIIQNQTFDTDDRFYQPSLELHLPKAYFSLNEMERCLVQEFFRTLYIWPAKSKQGELFGAFAQHRQPYFFLSPKSLWQGSKSQPPLIKMVKKKGWWQQGSPTHQMALRRKSRHPQGDRDQTWRTSAYSTTCSGSRWRLQIPWTKIRTEVFRAEMECETANSITWETRTT